MSSPHQSSESVEKAPITHVKRIIRLKKRHHGEHVEEGLNIYPMMDIMTIILVFMIMQFASSSASIIQESPEMKIPYSTSEVQTDAALPIQISRNEISVEGEQVLSLRDGQVDPSQKRGGGNGFVISPLLKRMKREAEKKKLIAKKNTQRPFKGEVLIVADQRTPYRTLSEVIYTLGQSEFSKLRFVVNKKGPAN